MKKLIPILIITTVLAFLSSQQSRRRLNEHGEVEYVYKDKVFFFLMAFSMAFFVGLRTRGNDTYTYRTMYESMPVGLNPIQLLVSTSIASAPGLNFLCAVLRNMGATTQSYFMVCALFTNLTYLWFLRKYTTDIGLSVFYFIAMGVYTFTMAAIKQTLAVAFLLIATDRAIEKKWPKYIFWLVIAELFHPYAFVYLVVPFLTFAPWTNKNYLLLAGTVVVALFLSKFMGAIEGLTDAMGYNYEASEFSGAGVNIFRVIVVWVPVVLSYFCKEQLRECEDREQNIIINLSMMNSAIMFIGLFGTANYFARLANYFLIFQCLALPRILQKMGGISLIKPASVLGFSGYFYYGTVLANGAFDMDYGFISVWDFFEQLF